jgi:ribosomal protein S18 acetylase RimI-like enzyme
MDITIRRVTKDDDFAALGNIYAQSWKAAYRGIVAQEYLDSLSGARWESRLAASAKYAQSVEHLESELDENRYDAYTVIVDGIYAGTSSICPARNKEMAGWGEIISIYLLPDYFGRGLGKPLIEAAIAGLVERGFHDIYLWVLEANARARRFYEKNGFSWNGDKALISIAGEELSEVRYIKCVQ